MVKYFGYIKFVLQSPDLIVFVSPQMYSTRFTIQADILVSVLVPLLVYTVHIPLNTCT